MADPTPAAPATAGDPMEMLKSSSYVQLLVLAALVGVPVSAVAYGYLALVGHLQHWFFTSIPASPRIPRHPGVVALPAPRSWPASWSACRSRTFPGPRVTSRRRDCKTGGAPQPIELFGVVLAALATLSFGVVLGPEAPLIAIGGGLGVLAVKLAARDAPPMAATVWPRPAASPPSARCSAPRSSGPSC